ncbi:hypothetical protein E2C01_046662 [Portunus trituberculatus]|uniref:Uncharacterized protein n=1 Tax=Portunus trituberculatus TaxID=210409 RepID=A0A5B7G5N7_PORTR|nr:hypothetical protein [Portunus trituberculatus]
MEPEHWSAITQLPSVPDTFTLWSATQARISLSAERRKCGEEMLSVKHMV